MKYKFLNFNIHNFTILFVILSIYYIFYNTGLHGDDYSVIREYDKNSFKLFFSINPEVRNQNIFGIFNHYFFYWAYPLFKYNFQYFYDLLKISINFISFIFFYKFLTLYYSKNRAFFFSIGFIFFPIHDSTIFWYMVSPYVFTPSIIFYGGYLLKKNYNILICITVLLIGAFSHYSSPPFLFGLSAILLFERRYIKSIIVLIILLLYSSFYFIISFIYPLSEKRITSDLNTIDILKNYFLQIFSNVDTFFGPSFYLKILYSISSITIISFFLASALSIFAFKKCKFSNSDFSKSLFFGFIIISLSSLFIFSLTNQYWQSPFNLGNRTTVSSTLIIMFLFCLIRNHKIFIIIFSILIIYPIFGLSDHWKKWNQNQKEIIENISNNDEFKKITNNDLLIISDNMYSELDNSLHIELFISPWVADSIFDKHSDYKNIFPLNQYSILYNKTLKNTKFNESFNLKDYNNIYLYSSINNTLKSINISELEKEINNTKHKKNRHWIQMIRNQYIINLILNIDPKLKYLFS